MVNVYIPNDKQQQLYQKLIKILEQYEDIKVWLIAGEVKGVMDATRDRSGIEHKQGNIPYVFREWFKLQDLTDIWRYYNGDKKDYTFYLPRCNSYLQIDYVFISMSYVNYRMISYSGVKKYADHAPELVSCQRRISTSYSWCLNNIVVHNQDNVQCIKKEIKAFFKINQNTVRLQTVWDAFKTYARGICIME